MRYIYVTLLTALFFNSCSYKDKENTTKKEKKQFETYERSEMASMMLFMFDFNMQLKAEIEAGKSVSTFPDNFKQLSQLKMTSGHIKDDFFEQHLDTFLAYQKEVFDKPNSRVENFNAMVQSCIACHQVKCTGPISKIEKLFIR